MLDIPPYAFWTILSGLFIGLVVTGIWYGARVSRDKHTAKIMDAKQKDTTISDWCSAFLEVVRPLKFEMMRAQIPSDWYGRFKISIPILVRLTSSVPDGFDATRRDEIVSIVQELSSMSAGQGSQAVYGAQKVVEMLHRLEELTDDT